MGNMLHHPSVDQPLPRGEQVWTVRVVKEHDIVDPRKVARVEQVENRHWTARRSCVGECYRQA